MKAYAALLVLAYVAYCYAADKTNGQTCASGDKCTDGTTCMTTKNCNNGKCGCKAGYYHSSGDKACKKMMKVGEACSTISDCYSSASMTCTSSKCACKTNRNANSAKTYCSKMVGDACSTSADCTNNGGTYMECKSSKCACMAAYKEDDKMCRPYKLGEDCSGTPTKTCIAGSCSSNKCSCSNSLVGYLDVFCIDSGASKNLGLGATCTVSKTGSTAKICGSGLNCGECPGQSGTFVCMSGATSIQAGFITAALAALLAFFRI